jgi:hypothetical protein
MTTLQEHIDALDRMVEQGTSVPKLRSQIAFIGREVAAFEADYSSLGQAHADLQKAHTKPQEAESQAVDECIHAGIIFKRGKRTGGVWAPFCHCGRPALIDDNDMVACSAGCPWICNVSRTELAQILKTL